MPIVAVFPSSEDVPAASVPVDIRVNER